MHILTGNGGGKTLAAVGLAVRAAGHGQNVVIVQFMKGRMTGELRMSRKIPHLVMRQFGRKGFVNPGKPEKRDYELAEKGLAFAAESLRKKPSMIILDEINVAVKFGLLSEKQVHEFLNKVQKSTLVVLTGRYAPQSFVKRAELVIEMKNVKEPKKPVAKKGVAW